MKREEILAMNPGRELDALVAEKVFGLQIHWEQTEWSDPYPVDERGIIVDLFSEGILEAFEVVEKMQEWGGCDIGCYGNSRTRPERKKWYTVETYVNGKMHSITANTLPEAICKAALLAVMEE